MARKIVLWMFTLLLCPLWANAQYTTSYQWGVQDITNYTTGHSGKNAWKLLSGGMTCLADGLTIGYDGSIWCRSASQVYAYNSVTQNWDSTGMGSGIQGLAVQDRNTIFSLQTTAHCTAYNEYQIFKWSGSSWVVQNGCLQQFAIGADGMIAGVSNSGQLWTLSSGGTWTQLGPGAGWTYAAIADQYTICGINAGNLYQLVSGAMTLMSPQPGWTLAGCTVVQDDPVFMTWSTGGVVSLLNPSTNSWATVTGLGSKWVVSVRKGETFALDSPGHPYHWNVYPLSLTGRISGSLNGCPAPGDPCAPGVTHTASIQVKFPYSVNGAIGSQAGSPTTFLDVTSWDANPFCDPFFGNPSDPECQPTIPRDQVICSATGENLTGGASPPKWAISHGAYTRAGLPMYSAPWFDGNRWWETATDNVNPACTAGTAPTCLQVDLEFWEWNTILAGVQADAIAAAYSGPWTTRAIYIQSLGPSSCALIPASTLKHQVVPQPCD